MIIYYCIAIIANIVAAIAFQKNINITGLSLIPLFLIALMIFQALIFRNEKVENGFRTAYGSNLTADEENKLLSSGSSFLFARCVCVCKIFTETNATFHLKFILISLLLFSYCKYAIYIYNLVIFLHQAPY